MQEANLQKTKKARGEENVPGVEEAVAGSGVARARRLRAAALRLFGSLSLFGLLSLPVLGFFLLYL